MSVTLSSLRNIRSLRAQARSMATEDLAELLSKLKVIIGERREEMQAAAEQTREKAEKLAMYRELLLEDGISPAELSGGEKSAGKQKRAPRPAKYKYSDANNETRHWTGQGRMPLPIKNAIENGQSLNDFLI